MKRLRYFLFLILPFFLAACGDDDPQNNLFEIWISEAPQGVEQTIDDTECGISTNGEAQTIAITLVGDYDSFRVTSSIPDWIYCTTSESIMKFKLTEYFGGEYDMRSAEITFTVTKGKSSVDGRVIIHQYALTDRVPPMPVNLNFTDIAHWSMYGVQTGQYRYFNAAEKIPSDFPYTSTSATGYGGIWLIGSPSGATLAYDASCPVEGNPDVRINIESASFEGVCPQCHSHYDMFNNGLPKSGKAEELGYGLKQYRVVAQSNGGVLVTN